LSNDFGLLSSEVFSLDLAKVINNIYDFGLKYPDFFDRIVFLAKKYDEQPHYGRNPKHTDLFRILSEREREPNVSEMEYIEMKEEVHSLKLKYPEAFDEFKWLIRKYAVMGENGIGYKSFVPCPFEADERICQKSKNIVNKFLKILQIENIEILETTLEELIKKKNFNENID
ncbi:MAG: hypothetical protein QME46_11135, partial [Thermoanaerobacteraceae bacterium]|nr:hypothetical protein [Thermoanaerobacteraceae bacterium]